MIQITRLGWLIIGLTFGVLNIWAHNMMVGIIFGWSFGKVIFGEFDSDKSNKH